MWHVPKLELMVVLPCLKGTLGKDCLFLTINRTTAQNIAQLLHFSGEHGALVKQALHTEKYISDMIPPLQLL